jgi:hypothetical protein
MGAEIQGSFGGRVTIAFGSLKLVATEAAIKLDPATAEVSAKANQDGSAAYESKPELVGAEMTLRNVGDINWSLLNQQYGNVTIVEQTNGRTHLFTGTRFIGKPSVDISTGDVSGLRIAGGTYQFRAQS